MTFKQLSLVLIIIWIHGSSCEGILSDISDCSEIEAERHEIPSIWLTAENNREDNDFILKEKKVNRIANKTRTFILRCWATFPITMLSTQDIKNQQVIYKMKNNFKKEHFKSLQIYIENYVFDVESNKELHLEVSCITTCDPNRFLHGVKIYTKEAGENFNKIFTEKVSSDPGGSLRLKRRLLRLLMDLGLFAAWGFVILALITTFGHVSWRQWGNQFEDIPLNVLND